MERATLSAKTKTIIVSTVVLIGAVGGGVWYNQTHQTKQTTPSATQTATATPQKTESISYKGEDGKTALELLKTNATAVTKQSSMGEYVTSINGNDGGGKKYWLFFVDGKESSVGAGAYVTKSGENIEWKLQ